MTEWEKMAAEQERNLLLYFRKICAAGNGEIHAVVNVRSNVIDVIPAPRFRSDKEREIFERTE